MFDARRVVWSVAPLCRQSQVFFSQRYARSKPFDHRDILSINWEGANHDQVSVVEQEARCALRCRGGYGHASPKKGIGPHTRAPPSPKSQCWSVRSQTGRHLDFFFDLVQLCFLGCGGAGRGGGLKAGSREPNTFFWRGGFVILPFVSRASHRIVSSLQGSARLSYLHQWSCSGSCRGWDRPNVVQNSRVGSKWFPQNEPCNCVKLEALQWLRPTWFHAQTACILLRTCASLRFSIYADEAWKLDVLLGFCGRHKGRRIFARVFVEDKGEDMNLHGFLCKTVIYWKRRYSFVFFSWCP